MKLDKATKKMFENHAWAGDALINALERYIETCLELKGLSEGFDEEE